MLTSFLVPVRLSDQGQGLLAPPCPFILLMTAWCFPSSPFSSKVTLKCSFMAM